VTRWQRFYRRFGYTKAERERFWSISHLARVLLRCGFLMRDPDCRPVAASYFDNHLWQWRFWRGPYWAVLATAPYRVESAGEVSFFVADARWLMSVLPSREHEERP
jgi:hypothetical protein